MVGGLGALSIAYLPASGKFTDYAAMLQRYPLLNAVTKAGVVFTLSYHWLGGLRHLVRRPA